MQIAVQQQAKDDRVNMNKFAVQNSFQNVSKCIHNFQKAPIHTHNDTCTIIDALYILSLLCT